MNTLDTEIVLQRGDARLVVSPYGASLRGLTYKGQTVATGYMGAKAKVGGEGDVLIPFPGRVAGGRYRFGNQTYQMEKTDHEGPNAIHGFLRHQLWDVPAQSSDAVTFTTALKPSEHAGYPFALHAEVTYHVTETGLRCQFVLENTGDGPAPVAAGFHPYFTVGSEMIDTDTLTVPFGEYLEFDDALIPTGGVLSVENTPLDFRQPRTIGETVFNTCYASPARDENGHAHVTLRGANGRTVTVTMDDAFGYVVLYSGDPLPPGRRRAALAIEPMTCASDAFNHPEWGLSILNPGDKLSGLWSVDAGG